MREGYLAILWLSSLRIISLSKNIEQNKNIMGNMILINQNTIGLSRVKHF